MRWGKINETCASVTSEGNEPIIDRKEEEEEEAEEDPRRQRAD